MAGELPKAVLFACTKNAIRSPMAAELMRLRFAALIRVDSAGVRPSEAIDPIAAEVLDELGGEIEKYRPKALESLEDVRYDLIISLSPEAHHRALNLIPALAEAAEYWATFDPSLTEGSREQRLMEYRLVRDGLDRRIAWRFQRPLPG